MPTVRKTSGRSEFDAMWVLAKALLVDLTAVRTKVVAAIVDLGVIRTPVVASLVDIQAALTRYENGAVDWPNVGNGGTNGRLRTNAPAAYRIAGALYNKASTDDLWNLSGETTLGGAEYKAYWLYLDSGGTASIAGGTVAASAAAAIAALPAVTSTKSVIGVYVAGPSTNFANALAAQGTIYNGWPGAYTMTAASPAALTASAPAALTSEDVTLIGA